MLLRLCKFNLHDFKKAGFDQESYLNYTVQYELIFKLMRWMIVTILNMTGFEKKIFLSCIKLLSNR